MTYVMGYNCELPKKQDYDDFITRLQESIKSHSLLGDVFAYCYGSVSRNEHIPGSSDIDFLFVFPEVKTNKEALSELGECLEEATRPWFEQETFIRYEYTIADEVTMRDGRFNSFDPSFKKYFEQEGFCFSGGTDLARYTYLIPAMNSQPRVTSDLKKLRGALVARPFLLKHDPHAAVESFDRFVTKAPTAIKRLMMMETEDLYVNRFSALSVLDERFPDIDQSPLERLRLLHQNPNSRIRMMKSEDAMHKTMRESLTFLEELVECYITKHPKVL